MTILSSPPLLKPSENNEELEGEQEEEEDYHVPVAATSFSSIDAIDSWRKKGRRSKEGVPPRKRRPKWERAFDIFVHEHHSNLSLDMRLSYITSAKSFLRIAVEQMGKAYPRSLRRLLRMKDGLK